MRILAAEPYGTPSHLAFLEGLVRHSRHEVVVRSLPPRAWKWRMRTASLDVAAALAEPDGRPFDLLFASDFLNVPETLAALPRGRRGLPCVTYFHENQLTYPLQPGERRDVHHGLTHVHSALASERALFNSSFHRAEFLAAARTLARKVPDVELGPALDAIEARARVLPLGLDGAELPAAPPERLGRCVEAPVILWPHRWEWDKAPEDFLAALELLEERGERFRLRLAGQRFRERPAALAEIERRFADRLVASTFASRREHLANLADCHVVVSTARHEFFGLGVLEAMRAGALPVLPNALAYPELVPEEHRYPAGDVEACAEALARALATVRTGAQVDLRRDLVSSTDRFLWTDLAPRYDAVFGAAVAGQEV